MFFIVFLLPLISMADIHFQREPESKKILALLDSRNDSLDLVDILKNVGLCTKVTFSKKLDVTNCFSTPLNEIFLKGSFFEGPNCFGSALAFSGLKPFFNEASEEELKAFIGSKYCKKINSKNAKSGDILVFVKEDSTIHAFNFLNKKYGFTKNGFAKEVPYTIEPLAATIKLYSSHYLGECEDCRGKEHSLDCKYCMSPVLTQTYHCEKAWGERNNQAPVFEKILDFDKKNQAILFGKTTPTLLDMEKQMVDLYQISEELKLESNSLEKKIAAEALIRISDSLSGYYRVVLSGKATKDQFYLVKSNWFNREME